MMEEKNEEQQEPNGLLLLKAIIGLAVAGYCLYILFK